MMGRKTVAVVGAGASGLAAGKVLLEDGFDVTVFDRQKTVGGIWSPDSAYVDLKAQSIGGFMEYSNLPDVDAEDYASWQSLHNYLQKYADTFHITERILFENKVILIDKDDLKNPNLPWVVEVETADGQHQIFQFDFVVVASGLFNTPYIPVFRGQNKFAGSIVHANDIKAHEQFENKRTVIIGGGKSAVDSAMSASTYARSCYMIFRRSHWMVPYNLLRGYLPLEYIFFTRFFSVLSDSFPYAPHSALFHRLHPIFSSVRDKIYNMMDDAMIATYKSDLYEDRKFIPKGSMRTTENLARITDEFPQAIREGRIIRKLGCVDEISDETTIRLDSGELLQADLIVCATGFIERFPFFSEIFNRILGQNPTTQTTSNEGFDLDLYRRIAPVGVPNIAFVGLTATGILWPLFEVQSHWTSDYFLGRIKLPATASEMYEEIRTTQSFIQRLFNRKSYYLQYYWLEPIEIYLQDMGVSSHRTNNWISEYLGVYRPRRIQTLHDERQAKAEGRTPGIWHRRRYFGFGHTIVLLVLLSLCFRSFFERTKFLEA